LKKESSKRAPLYRKRAKEALLEMEALLAADHPSGAVDRAYYAVFHSAQAILANIGLEFSSHEAVISAFGKEFAKTKKVDAKFHRILREAFDLRLTADYDVENSVDDSHAKKLCEECRGFLREMERYLDRN